MNDKFENLVSQYNKALLRLQDVMTKKKDEYIRDSAIQRFEFTYELAKAIAPYSEMIELGIPFSQKRQKAKNPQITDSGNNADILIDFQFFPAAGWLGFWHTLVK